MRSPDSESFPKFPQQLEPLDSRWFWPFEILLSALIH